MKTKIFYLAVVLAACLFLLSCQNRFVEKYPSLRLNQYEYQLDINGGNFEFMVYCSCPWHCRLVSDDAQWVVLSRDRADGQAYIRVTYDSCIENPRVAYIEITAENGDKATVTLNQKAK